MRSKHLKLIFATTIIIAVGLWFRLYHIEFGLPHSFHADEPEIAELAIKYTYEIRGIIKNNDYYKLIPISYVYGMFPTYFLTAGVMLFSKTSNLLNIPFDKTTLYIVMRTLIAVFSLLLIPTAALIYYKLFNDKFGTLVTASLVSLNWKLIVQSHYVNADIILTVLLTISYLGILLYHQRETDTKFTLLTGLAFGFAVGTKVTALLTIPLFLAIFYIKKDVRGFLAFIFLALLGFTLSNPFSLIFANDFAFRIYMMKAKEGGIVFDSVDADPLKYIKALFFIATPVVLLISVYGQLAVLKLRRSLPIHAILILSVIIYLIFYSLGNRNVDRWLLPILPIVLIYAGYGVSLIRTYFNKIPLTVITIVTIISYLYFPSLLLLQFQRNTPKSAAYIWMRDNTQPQSNKLAVTEEGLDPLNKLEGILVKRYEVYSNEAAQFFMPESPIGYDYVILSSKPMKNYKKTEIIERYRFYTDAWQKFEEEVMDPANFKLVKQFVLPKPNLVNLSDVFIYERVGFTNSL